MLEFTTFVTMVEDIVDASQVVPKEHLDEMDKATDILANLCAFAPDTEIRDCLRRYQPGKNVIQLRSAFNRDTKIIVTNTLEYLGVTANWNEYMKPECVDKLIYRIKNLQPKICEYCNDTYTVDKDASTLLPCHRCGQDVHRTCLLNILKVDNQDMIEADVRKMLNPFGIPSLHHLCKECEGYMNTKDMPLANKSKETKKDDLDANKQDKETQVTSQQIEGGKNTFSIIDRGLEGFIHPNRGSQTCLHSANDHQDDHYDHDHTHTDNEPAVCKHYKKGNCKHGRKGINCEYSHPKPCSKLMKHGNKGPRGCKKG